MGLETGTFIDDLVRTNPLGTDDRSTADDHLRLIKDLILNTFPNIDAAVNPTPTEFNRLVGITAALMDLGGGQSVAGATTFSTLTVTSVLNVSGAVNIEGGYTEDADTIAASTIDVSAATYHYKTISGATTFVFTGAPAAGDVASFTLELTNAGTNITWPTSVDWPVGVVPTLTGTGVDILTFTTRDAGVTWYGFLAGLDMK